MFSKLTAATAALAFGLSAGTALAQDAGATIIGNDGNPVGTVASNDGTTVVVDTGMHQVPLGPESFAEADGTFTLNTTQAELNAAMDAMVAQQQEALAAALVVGAEVNSADAQPLGTIEELTAENIILADGEQKMTLPRDLFAVDANGGAMVLANHADIMAALNAQG